MSYISTSVEIDVRDVLDELDDEELLDEIERRSLDLNSRFIDGDQMREMLTQVWLKRRQGQDFAKELDDLIYYGLGRIA